MVGAGPGVSARASGFLCHEKAPASQPRLPDLVETYLLTAKSGIVKVKFRKAGIDYG